MLRGFLKKKPYLWLVLFSLSLALVLAVWQIFLRPRLNFPRSESDYYASDPVLGHRHRPFARREFGWPEHPSGRIVMQTNNLGMRRDQDTQPRKPDGTARVLVLGDSHLDGVVYNGESFSTLLEFLLNSAHDGLPRFEVLNAAAGHYGPDNYRAALDAYGDLGIDAMIVGFYVGNDFLDAAREIERRLPHPPDRPREYMRRLRRANKAHPGAVAQLLNQACYFDTHPEMQDAALKRAEALMLELHRRASQKHVLFFVLLIPTKPEIEPQHLDQAWTTAVSELQLGERALQITPRLRIALGERLRQAGIRCLDPAGLMQKQPSEVFWRQDYHLNVAGHRVLARGFYDAFRELFGAF